MAADAFSRPPSSGLITPTSDGSLPVNSDSFSLPGSIKRKRKDPVAMDHLLKPSIIIKPYPPNLHAHPTMLQPLMLLSRKYLPLADLDLDDPSGSLLRSRVYESQIKILELENRFGTSDSVLIARHDLNKSLYAIERRESGQYTICKLGAWVRLTELAAKAVIVNEDRLLVPELVPRATDTSVSLTTPRLHSESKKKNAAIQAIQTLVRKGNKPESTPVPEGADGIGHQLEEATPAPEVEQQRSHTITTPHGKLAEGKEADAGNATYTPGGGHLDEPPQMTAEIIFDSIRGQYFEALYKSKGSLAYFAKGPLSRARSNFQLDLDSKLEIADLIEFLKTLVLTTVQIDKKFRESIPDLVTKLGAIIDSEEEARKKKQRTKKMRVGKDGLYPVEAELIRNWWTLNKPEVQEGEIGVSTAQIKSLASALRTRETQLQTILILEILALEPLRAAEEESMPFLPGDLDSQQQTAPAPPKKKNKHNLPVLVHVHADRLTIWQSTLLDESLVDESQQPTQPAEVPVQNSSSEPLRDFCTDVIVPFFSARLPDICASLNAKLGGPVLVSAAKSKQSKKSSSKPTQKAMAAIKRPLAIKAPRTLQRALSTDYSHRRSLSRGPTNAIALMRSATSASVPGIKREESEPPKHDDSSNKARQGGLSRSSSMVNLTEARASKKAKIDAELKDAISMLRKPNRHVVGKEVADAATLRASHTNAKKPKRPVRQSLDSGVMVMATPANNRFKNMLETAPQSLADIPQFSTDDVIPPSSIGAHIPSTALRTSHSSRAAPDRSPIDVIGHTPTRPPSNISFLRRIANNDSAVLQSSPLGERLGNAANTTSMGPVKKLDLHPREIGVFETPMKKAPARLEFQQGQGLQLQPQSKTSSIYEKLGWDNEFDDL